MSKVFVTVNIHNFTETHTNKHSKHHHQVHSKLHAYTQYNGTFSKLQQINARLPQVGVLYPTLFNIYASDIPLPPKDVQITTYADGITITASHTKHCEAQQLIQPYFYKIYEWVATNNLHINTDKTTTTLFTPDPAEYVKTLLFKLNNQTPLPTTKHPKILRITLDLKLTFSQHIIVTITKAKQTLSILKALTSNKWGKQKELIVSTFTAISRPILDYANTVWSPKQDNSTGKICQRANPVGK